MTRDDIERMAREADFYACSVPPFTVGWDQPNEAWLIARDTKLVALVSDYLLSTSIHSCHANCQRFACVQTRKAVEEEREAILHMSQSQWFKTQADFEAAIRARGEKK